ncbi:hypothetical protein [Afipia carboxidovorans]|uniref:hypothetical protein n=1 Tax=Afipia carboxidovorans TaxID=40137 RepID=UPI003086BE90|nr:hypothetical protein CRBSH125_05710 [Afipia carboxidovorans]
MHDPVPPGAERLHYEAAIRTVKRPSKFVPGQTAFAEVFHCPKCETEMDMPREGRNVSCRCGLRMQLQAMQVIVWPGVEVVA